MIAMLAGLAAAFGIWWGVKAFGRLEPSDVKPLLRKAGGLLVIAVALLLGLKGRLDEALILAAGGAGLLGWGALPAWMRGSAKAGQTRLRSRMVETVVDATTGSVDGRVLAGRFRGRALSSLSETELGALYDETVRDDPEGARLLEAHLNGRAAGRREHAHRDDDARRREANRAAMPEQEAYEILGLQPGADPETIERAYRTLMKRLHPDQGGSTYLASRVNQAKDVLLSRHR